MNARAVARSPVSAVAARGWLCLLLLAAALFAVSPAQAQPQPARADAWVAAVQMPAWVERGGTREPLLPGTPLRTGDVVITGADARVQLRLAEGSTVKLGANGRLALADLRVSRGASIVLTGLLEIAQGAFRFTTAAIQRTRSERDLQLRIATVTAGIRGTDVWGRGNAQNEIVCLIEGRITVTRGSEAPITMSEPLSFFIAPVGAPALPVAPVDPKQLAQWALETELTPGAGAATQGGRSALTVLTTTEEAEALKMWDTLRAAGFAAQIRPTKTETGISYVVRIGNLANEREARGLAARIAGITGAAAAPAAAPPAGAR
jgi:hypothetical protein